MRAIGTGRAKPVVVQIDELGDPKSAAKRFELVGGSPKVDVRAKMAREVRSSLIQTQRSIPPKYFYDAVGSQLFDAICDLPEYYLTRAERSLLLAHAERILEVSGASSLVEIGSGMARKTAPLLRALCARAGRATPQASPLYVPFDIAPDAIRQSAAALLPAFPSLRVRGVVGDFMRDSARLSQAAPAEEGPRLFVFLGSTIGNLDDAEAPAFLRSIAGLMTERDRLLLGVDLVKDADVLHAAYNDSRGLTAEFNKNILRVVARELDGEVDVDAYSHLAFYDARLQRIEMHLVSARAQPFTLRIADVRFEVARDERILTELSRKFTRASTESMLAQGGFRLLDWSVDRPGGVGEGFALVLAAAGAPQAAGQKIDNQQNVKAPDALRSHLERE